MSDSRRFASAVAVGLLVALSVATTAQAAILPAAALFADAQAKERAVRRALAESRPSPAVLKAVRTVVAEYESVVRHYPATAYCDDALWKAAQLSLDAYRKFGEAQDAASATRLFRRLSTEYPTSQWARQAKNQPLPPVTPEPSQARASAPASRPEPAVQVADATTVMRPPTATPAPLSRDIATPVARVVERSVEPVPAPSPTPVLVSAPSPATITRIERKALQDVVRLTIAISGEVTYREERLSGPPRLFFDFPGTRPSAELMDRTLSFNADGDIVREVRVGRHPNRTTRVVLDTAGASDCSVYPLYVPYRVVIDCVRASGAGAPRPVASSRAVATTGSSSAAGAIAPPGRGPVSRSGGPAATVVSEPVLKPVLDAASPPGPLVARSSTPAIGALSGRPLLSARQSVPPSRDDWPSVRAPIEPVTLRAPALEAPTQVRPVAVPSPPVAPTAPAGNLSGGFSIARQLGLGVSRIVIDPGHGGHDPGAKGSGLSEASLVLDIALRLEQLLKQMPGTEVVLTRRADVFVSLEERTALANRAGADLFLSIHANAASSGQAGGVETYFLNFASSRQAAAVAARENAASGQSMNALPDFVKAIALNNKLDESRDFATQVQRTLVQRLKPSNQALRDLGVKQAPFVVLIGAAMPSVLAEVAFVTNEQEARLLRGGPYRQKIAEALASAVQKYQASLNGVGAAAQP